MHVQFGRYDFRGRIAGRQRRSLAAGSGAAVKQARASADQRGNELRSLVLDEDAAFAKRPRSGYVSSDDHARRCQQCSGNNLKAFALQLWFDLDAVEADRGARNTLVVFANCARTLRAELGDPAFHQPLGMGEFTRQECNRIANDRFRRKLDLLVGYLPQHRVRKRHRGALLRLLYQLYAFVDCRARRHSRQELQLVDRKPQRGQYLRIQLVQRTRRCCGDDLVQPRTPAQNTHDELHRQSAIGEAKPFEFLRVQQLAGVGVLLVHAQQNVKGSNAGGRHWHIHLHRSAQSLGTSRRVAVDEGPRAHPLLALRLKFLHFERSAMREAQQQTIVRNREVTSGDYANLGCRYGRVQVQRLPAKCRESPRPRLKSTQPVPRIHCRAREIDESVFTRENGRERGLRVVLRTRCEGSVFEAGKGDDDQLGTGLRQTWRQR